MRRPRRHEERLLARLAMTPAPLVDGRRPPIRLVYGGFAFAAVVLLVAWMILEAADTVPWAVYALVALVVAWCLVAFVWALPQAFGAADRALGPLGLRVVAKPTYVPNIAVGGGRLDGAIVYGGERHGRQVEIRQTPAEAVTVVSRTNGGWDAPRSVSTAAEMAELTGEPEAAWKHVVVEIGTHHVAVRRRRTGAGGWMLHDLLLAEVVAGRG